MEIKKLISTTAVGDLVQKHEHQELTVVNSNEDLSNTFDMLISKKIHSVPVINKETHQYLGILDMKDFVAYILWLFGDKTKTKLEFMPDTPEDILNLWKKNPFVGVLSTSSVAEALDYLSKHHLHRLPVIDSVSKTKVTAMLSQSTIISWLYLQNATVLEPLKISVDKMASSSKKLISMPESSLMLAVFQKLYECDIYGCAITNDEGKLVGNISVTDLQFSINENLEYLGSPVSKLFQDFKRYKPVTVTSSNTVLEAVGLAVENGVHRVYIVDKDNKPTGLITLTDLLDFVHQIIKS